MLDFTNYNHKRGLMVLNSKDVRTVDNSLFDYRVDLRLVKENLEMISKMKDRMSFDTDELDHDFTFIMNNTLEYIEDAQKLVDRAKNVFR